MNKHKTEDYKMSAVKFFFIYNDLLLVNLDLFENTNPLILMLHLYYLLVLDIFFYI